MYCSNCGAEIADDAQFCPRCGAPVKGAQAAANDRNSVNVQRMNINASVPQGQQAAKAKSSSPKWRVIIPVAIVVVVVIAIVMMSSGGMSNSNLKALAQENGISPYDFKKAVTKEYGSSKYQEGVSWLSESSAELVQYCQIEDAGVYAGVYLLTYSDTINTSANNAAEQDIFRVVRMFTGRSLTVYVNNDYSYYHIIMEEGMYGSYDASFRIVGNSLVFANPYTSYGMSGYEILSALDTDGSFKMSEVNENNLTDITTEFAAALNNGAYLED